MIATAKQGRIKAGHIRKTNTFKTTTRTHIFVQGFEMEFVEVPLHRIHLSSVIVSVDVAVGVRSALSRPGTAFSLRNDLAGGMFRERVLW